MATAEVAPRFTVGEESLALAGQLRRLTRAATVVALLASPALFVFDVHVLHWQWYWALLVTSAEIVAFRGLLDVFIRRVIPWPTLFGADERLTGEEVINRRRAWTWRFRYRWTVVLGTLGALAYAFLFWFLPDVVHLHINWHSPLTYQILAQTLLTGAALPLLFIVNFLILFGPLMLMAVSQMRSYEPGDANWGVKLDDVRGQAEAKEEVRKIVTLWQSGGFFERSGGKRERGLLFHGPPGTGKTMLAKAIATSFNAPFIAMPGSGFGQMFVGMDAIVVRLLAAKAKRLGRKWGGQCIVFIDEIDAVGMRRASLQGQNMTTIEQLRAATQFYGQMGSVNASGDLVVESAAWRDHVFRQRAPEPRSPYPPFVTTLADRWNQIAGGGMFGGGGQLALNQLLVVMDGMDGPPFLRRLLTNRLNTWLDAMYFVPQRLGRFSLRLPAPRPRKEQIYFIGATNVPLQSLDPALTRPGRMGRHVWFRTPTKDDRKDIFDLYLDKVAHEADIDTEQRRDEIARITNGYSPAMIDQVCSVALTYAHHDGREVFGREDLLEAMSVIESGAASDVKYVEHETRAVALHEAGHAAAAHVFRPDLESSRLSIRMRPGSLGHHQSFQREERFTTWHREYFGDLVHGLAAMATEQVFYGENASGVSGDLEYATQTAATMAGIAGMGTMPFDVDPQKGESDEQARERVLRRFEEIGAQLMNRTRGSADMHADPIASIMGDQFKRRRVAQILGQAYVTAYNFVTANRQKVDAIASQLVARRELYGDDLVELLDKQKFVKPELDWEKEETWPRM
ncbi:MAG TPA: AAA family ATPase [Gaiellaceae bacterium]|nr:AAA family ATPase [Gaiellaceae bacterium]